MSQKEMKEKLPTAEHKKQIRKYTKRYKKYQRFAKMLSDVFKNACQISLPEAVIQARAKTVSSFAEKCIRKYPKVKDGVTQFTDLCGLRVIVQTQQQVEAVKKFIEANFMILERDDKTTQLSEDRFGYRDMHYIVQLEPSRLEVLGIEEKDVQAFLIFKAEVQVRTWLQHGWADTLHDRIYKNPLTLPQEVKRTGALLAALMEEGDRTFDRMAVELDGMIANFTAFARRDQVQDEIEIQTMLLENEPVEEKKPVLALKLARLLASCGDYRRVMEVLSPYRDIRDANRCEMLQELAYATCKVNLAQPQPNDYNIGIQWLEESMDLCDCRNRYVVNLRKRENLYARALARLGWALNHVSGREYEAREFWHRAHELEPDNPYYLAEMLGLEMHYSPQSSFSVIMRTTLRRAVKICRTHALDGIELPYAYFTAGRLLLLLDEPLGTKESNKTRASYTALAYYARGIHYVLADQHCFPDDVLQSEIQWIADIYKGHKLPEHFQWAHDLLQLAEDENGKKKREREEKKKLSTDSDDKKAKTREEIHPTLKVLIMAGGAATMDSSMVEKIKPLVDAALRPFSGTVISGGTISGVPGCVGEVSAELAAKGEKQFTVVGYLTHRLPTDAPKDNRYDRFVECGEAHFTPEQLLKMWKDLFSDGIRPQEIICFGFGGGPLSAVEYCMALALGATVTVVSSTAGTADELIADPLWAGVPTLLPIPPDTSTVRALAVPPVVRFEETTGEEMAKAFHENYVAGSSSKLPDNMKPWNKLAETYQKANLEQAKYSIQILEANGFDVQPSVSPVIFTGFTPDEIEEMAKMEHGRWNTERLRDGWRLGPRDDQKKLHPNLVEWEKLPDGEDGVKKYDREAVQKFSEILKKAGLEVYRK